MKFIVINYSLFFIISTISYAQIGIGTTNPIATLDIKNNNATKNAISITNSSNDVHLSLTNTSDLNIGIGAFSPNNNPGTEEYYLISQGPNKPPKWERLDGNFVYSGLQVIQRKYDNYSGAGGSTIPVIFTSGREIIQDSNNKIAEIENNQYIKILAAGIYNISWNTSVSLGATTAGTVVGNGNSKLYYSNSKTNLTSFYTAYASQVVCNSIICDPFYNTSTTRISLTNKEITLNLEANDYIFMDLTASVVVPNTNYNLIRSSIQIKKINF